MKNLFLISFLLLTFNCFGKTEVSIIIYNGEVITVTDKGIINNAVVVIKDDTILDVGEKSLLDKYDAPVKIDAKNNIVMPGLINCHTHIPMVGFRGLGENGIKDRLFGFFFPLEKKFVSPEFVYLTSIHSCIEMVMGGVTTFCDMYYFMDKEAEAAKQIGMRAVLGETIINYPAPDAKKPEEAIEATVNFIKKYSKDALITPAFAPHCPYTVSDKYLKEVSELALKYDAPVVMHMAEIPEKENPKFKLDNIYHLKEVGLLRNKLILAHVIHVDSKQMEIIKNFNVGVSYNPLANAKGATGIADAYDMMKLGIPVGLGTDGPMSSNIQSLFAVMNYAANMQRILHEDRTIMVPKDIVYLATLGGAKALRLEKSIGSLEAGKKADVIIVDTSSPNMIPHYDLYATLVYQAEPSNVLTTIINGKIVMRDRKLLSYSQEQDEKDIAELSKEVSEYGKILEEKAKNSAVKK